MPGFADANHYHNNKLVKAVVAVDARCETSELRETTFQLLLTHEFKTHLLPYPSIDLLSIYLWRWLIISYRPNWLQILIVNCLDHTRWFLKFWKQMCFSIFHEYCPFLSTYSDITPYGSKNFKLLPLLEIISQPFKKPLQNFYLSGPHKSMYCFEILWI